MSIAVRLDPLGIVAEMLVSDWRKEEEMGRFDRILAADVLYEARNVEPLCLFIVRKLRDGGEAWITDPDRTRAQDLPVAARRHGLLHHPRSVLPRADGKVVHLHRLSRANGASSVDPAE